MNMFLVELFDDRFIRFVQICIDDRFIKSTIIYRGENAAYEFIEAIFQEHKYCKKIMKNFSIKVQL